MILLSFEFHYLGLAGFNPSSDNGKIVFKYNYDDYNFDKAIIDLLKERNFIHSSKHLDKIFEELSADDMSVDVNQINNIVKTFTRRMIILVTCIISL